MAGVRGRSKGLDNLFDRNFTFLDVVKIALLIVTAFSTWNIVTLITPPGAWAFVRNVAALVVVEGAYLGFEAATGRAKNKEQAKYATLGFFISVAVIGAFALVSGFLEVAGPTVTDAIMSTRFGVQWSVAVLIEAAALAVVVLWIVGLSVIYRLYSLNDPDLQYEMQRRLNDGELTTTVIHTTRAAIDDAKHPIAVGRAVSALRESFIDDMAPADLEEMLRGVRATLERKYGLRGGKKELPAPTEEVPSRPTPFAQYEQMELPHENGRNGKIDA